MFRVRRSSINFGLYESLQLLWPRQPSAPWPHVSNRPLSLRKAVKLSPQDALRKEGESCIRDAMKGLPLQVKVKVKLRCSAPSAGIAEIEQT